MAQTYKKGSHIPVGKHFTSDDFDCKCTRAECEASLIDDKLAEPIDLLWDLAGPFKINSGFRCVPHNLEVGGAPESYHLLGRAVDIQSLKGLTGSALAKLCVLINPFFNGGIGTASTWVHVDNRGIRARWNYPSQVSAC